MICLFCRSKCLVSTYYSYTAYRCDYCIVDDMSKYIVAYTNYPTMLVTRTMIIGDLHVAIDYENDRTVISKLVACFIMDPIILPRALIMDVKNPISIVDKIKTLLIFS